jgi:hypothetical protein
MTCVLLIILCTLSAQGVSCAEVAVPVSSCKTGEQDGVCSAKAEYAFDSEQDETLSLLQVQAKLTREAENKRSKQQRTSRLRQLAFQLALSEKSKGMQRLLSNASRLMEAALSSGVQLSIVDAKDMLKKHHDFIENEKVVLLGAPGDTHVDLTSALNDMVAMEINAQEKVADTINKGDSTAKKLNRAGTDASIGMAIASTCRLFIGFCKNDANGGSEALSWNRALEQADTWLPALASLTGNAPFAIGVTLLTSLFRGFFSEPKEDPIQQLYNKVMDDVKTLFKKENMKLAANNIKVEATAIIEELNWVPAMLVDDSYAAANGGMTTTIYYFMIQHDLAKLMKRITHQHAIQGWAEDSDNAKNFRANILPVAVSLLNLQINVLLEISRVNSHFKVVAAERIRTLCGTMEVWLLNSVQDFKVKRLTGIPTWQGVQAGRKVWARPVDRWGGRAGGGDASRINPDVTQLSDNSCHYAIEDTDNNDDRCTDTWSGENACTYMQCSAARFITNEDDAWDGVCLEQGACHPHTEASENAATDAAAPADPAEAAVPSEDAAYVPPRRSIRFLQDPVGPKRVCDANLKDAYTAVVNNEITKLEILARGLANLKHGKDSPGYSVINKTPNTATTTELETLMPLNGAKFVGDPKPKCLTVAAARGLDRFPRPVPAGFIFLPKSCVSGHNLPIQKGKTVDECATICSNDANCKAFEFGVNYGGSSYEAGDCQPQDGVHAGTCNGASYNLDLYIKIWDLPRSLRSYNTPR